MKVSKKKKRVFFKRKFSKKGFEEGCWRFFIIRFIFFFFMKFLLVFVNFKSGGN